MDLALTIASGSCAHVVAEWLQPASPTFRISLTLSFGILSLSLLEATPSSLRLLPELAWAYRILFFLIAVWLLLVLPVLMGSQGSPPLPAVDDDKALKLLCRRPSFWNRLLFFVNHSKKGPILAMTHHHHPDTARIRPWRLRLSSLLAVVVAWTVTSAVGRWIFPTSTAPSLLSQTILSLSAVGLALSAILNGYGSVSLPYNCLAGLYLEPVPPQAMAQAQVELQQAEAAARTDPSLEALVQDLKLDLEDMQLARSMVVQARTTVVGRIRAYVGALFSVVLLVRLGGMTLSLVSSADRASTCTDPVTRVLMWSMGDSQNYEQMQQLVSVTLTAILTISQVRSLVQTVRLVQRKWLGGRRSVGKSLLPFLIPCYFLACTVSTKALLPISYRQALEEALGAEWNASTAVDQVFVVSALLSVVVLLSSVGIQRALTQRYVASLHWKSNV